MTIEISIKVPTGSGIEEYLVVGGGNAIESSLDRDLATGSPFDADLGPPSIDSLGLLESSGSDAGPAALDDVGPPDLVEIGLGTEARAVQTDAPPPDIAELQAAAASADIGPPSLDEFVPSSAPGVGDAVPPPVEEIEQAISKPVKKKRSK